ncbi:MAG: hypothetical protein RMZ43_031215 [Nostoc sp. CmiVER01]|nr:hypothetical protein [Nostoc sp. CmiVER01]MDZ8126303.1 hypothetical protein [Nostoc sp. CmiVER01]
MAPAPKLLWNECVLGAIANILGGEPANGVGKGSVNLVIGGEAA